MRGSGTSQVGCSHPRRTDARPLLQLLESQGDPLVRRVRLLDEDPELGAGLSPQEFEQARFAVASELVELRPGIHALECVGSADDLGLLLVSGCIIRRVQIAERRSGELLGPGSIVRPWAEQGATDALVPLDVHWQVIAPTELVLLDERIVAALARWPSVMRTMLVRAVDRSHTLALLGAIHCLQHVELRLLSLFWHLADRFGRVTPEGIVIPLKLSHGNIADLVGSQRPTVSSRLVGLAERGQVLRRPDRSWLLCGDPPLAPRDVRVPRRAPD